MSEVLVLSGSAHPSLGGALARAVGADGSASMTRFHDGELHVSVERVEGKDVFVVQPLAAPVGDSLLELLLIADACHRTGARSVSAVIAYLGYARQERRTGEGQALAAQVVARLVAAGDFARVIVVDLHAPAIEGFFATMVDHLSAAPLLAGVLAGVPHDGHVIVAPDLGAAKLARRFAEKLNLPTALIAKARLSGSEVQAKQLIGEVRGLRPIIVDDMISTGGTIAEAVRAVLAAGAVPDITVAATHGLFVGPAVERLEPLPIKRLFVTDTLPVRASSLPIEMVSVAPMLGRAIRCRSEHRPLGDLLAAG